MSTEPNDRLNEITADKSRRQEAIAKLTQQSKKEGRNVLVTFVAFFGYCFALIVLAIILGKPETATSFMPTLLLLFLVITVVQSKQTGSEITLRRALEVLASRLDSLEVRLNDSESRGKDQETT